MSQYWPPQQPDESPTHGQRDSGYGYPDGGYGAPGPTSRGRGGQPPQQDDGWGTDGWPPSQYPQGPYQQAPNSRGPYQQGPNSQGLYRQGPNSQGLYRPGGEYGPGGYPQAQYPQDPYGQYANNPYGQPQGYGAPPVPARRRSGNWLLPLVLVVFAILVVGGGVYVMSHVEPTKTVSTTQGTATTTVAPGGVPAGFKQSTDASAHAQIALPQDWTTKGTISGAQGIMAISPDQNSYLLAKSYNFVGDKVGAANGAIDGGAGSGTVANKTGPTNVSLAGETWVQETADITRDGVTLHFVVLVTTHGDQTYLLAYYSTPSAFDEANNKYFQPAVQSFAFTA